MPDMSEMRLLLFELPWLLWEEFVPNDLIKVLFWVRNCSCCDREKEEPI